MAVASLFLVVGSVPAFAVPVEYDLSMFATTDNINYQSVFGLPTEFGGPFTGSLTLEYPQLPGGGAVATAFTMTIGNKTWGLDDIISLNASADSAGVLTFLFFRADDDDDPDPGDFGNVFEMFVDFGNTPAFWRAFSTTCLVGNNFISGACIQGIGVNDTQIVAQRVAPVPEPATLTLTALGIAGLARRRWPALRRVAARGRATT